ncbi:hypothetical protein CNEONATC25_02720 [Clostridium neonatale]|uniref:Uncharacterized protein n=1 Tax=Clostridium neonatale TaxID=137838 RepID=A0A650MFC4_9CLOT|nr:hypothetical protein CNEO_1200028 [Clostridium neonatale]CAG9706665.1 conserved hypothetical protein [Clostridium neonatale]CAI3588019.1 hypothetical protein CNEO4_1380008 [Clostridium neonatale]CAI3588660.1 hypothetical protein CNEO3_260040 [Clostridium neonatale]CAI3591253.1 hypothetical protein CNEO4_570024 [Clostridium neonatale]
MIYIYSLKIYLLEIEFFKQKLTVLYTFPDKKTKRVKEIEKFISLTLLLLS